MSTVLNPTTPVFSGTLPGFPGPVILGKEGANNALDGGDTRDYIQTGTGSDTASGRGLQDTLVLGGGDDSGYGANSDDILQGQEGNDKLSGGPGNDLVEGGAGDDTVYGNDDDDTVSGGEGNDLVMGDAGNDKLFGGRGNDTIDGGTGNDTIYGGKGNDLIDGRDGNDSLAGDRGSDVLTGGDGSDTFALISSDQNGLDTIVDFNPAQDKIALAVSDNGGKDPARVITSIGTSFEASEFLVTEVGTSNGKPDGSYVSLFLKNTNNTTAKIIYDKASGLLHVRNNDGNVQVLAQLKNGLTITAGNFEVF